MKRENRIWAQHALGVAKFIIYALALFAGALIYAAPVHAQVAELKACWDAPTQYVDGTQLPPDQLNRYEVEHTSLDGTQTFTVPAPNTGFEQTITQYGQHCYRVRAYAVNVPRPSEWTEEVCKAIAAPPAMVRFRQCD